MTTEEKARAYDEALERARKIHDQILNNELIGFPDQIREIFPQLREDEDERMLREFNDYLCEEIECRTNDVRDEKDRKTLNMLCFVLKKVDAWLKKQKYSKVSEENGKNFTISDDERIRTRLYEYFQKFLKYGNEDCYKYGGYVKWEGLDVKSILAYLEKQKEASKAIEAVERIDKYIDENLANAHDMKDSNPDKQYYRGWDEALGAMAEILEDVYFEEKEENK